MKQTKRNNRNIKKLYQTKYGGVFFFFFLTRNVSSYGGFSLKVHVDVVLLCRACLSLLTGVLLRIAHG